MGLRTANDPIGHSDRAADRVAVRDLGTRRSPTRGPRPLRPGAPRSARRPAALRRARGVGSGGRTPRPTGVLSRRGDAGRDRLRGALAAVALILVSAAVVTAMGLLAEAVSASVVTSGPGAGTVSDGRGSTWP
ncbi:hypothetical protein ACFQE5_11865 [Pseudonocardia hispaniensis]|uniref:Uncharacterized protein n=1 Tax=Pseudonocardia hispaniensis TaxID=904933 RepID=A0ABW1J2C9_9PSEU